MCEHTQLSPTLRNRMDCSLAGSSVHGIFQVRILEQVAISFSRGSSWCRDWTCISCISYTGRWSLYHCTTWMISKKDTHKSRWLLGNCNHTIATKRKRMFGTNFFKEYKPVNFQDTNGFLLFMPCCINNRIWIMKNIITLTHYTEMQYPIKCNFILLMTELQLSKFTSLEKALCCIHLSPAVD